jgi:hypothetical protein
MTNVQVREKLDSTAVDLGAAGRDNQFGYGLVNAKNALGIVTPSTLMSGSVVTDKETYSMGEAVSITVFVIDEVSNPVANASVKLDIVTPKGKVYTKMLTTGITGKAYSSYSPTRKDGKGIYRMNASIDKSGYPRVQNDASFQVING